MIEILEAGYKEKLSEKTSKIYWNMLNKYDDKTIKEATIECVRGLKYFPKISEIIELIEGSQADEPELAYLEFRKVLDDKGSYMSVSFPKYPAIPAVVEALGGWIRISDTLIDDEKWLKKDFIKLYNIMKRQGDYPKELIGRFELNNTNKGYNEKTMFGIYGRRLDSKKIDRKRLKGGG